MRPTRPLQYILEVGRKFTPTPLSVSHLRTNTGTPRLPKIQHCGSIIQKDIYFDRKDILCDNGIWVRQRKQSLPKIDKTSFGDEKICGSGGIETLTEKREVSWQAKIRKGGDRVNSSFAEVHDYDSILDLLRCRFPSLADLKRIEDLGVLARITCLREMWRVDGKFNVVIDETDFGHVVGEVELEVEFDTGGMGSGNGNEEWRGGLSGLVGGDRSGRNEEAALLKNMDTEIETFMRMYESAFPVEGRVVGKLTAYFEWLKANEERYG